MKLVGVTGTNGKTTTTYLLKDILEQALGAKVGLIGTNQNMIGSEIVPTERTTPESFELQRLFRRMAQIRGNLDHQRHIMIPADIFAAQGGHAFPAQADSRIGLRACLHIVLHLSVYGLDPDRSAKRSQRERDRYGGKDIHILSLEQRMPGYHDFHQQIASRPSVGPRFSFSADPDALSVVDACRNRDGDLLFTGARRHQS